MKRIAKAKRRLSRIFYLLDLQPERQRTGEANLRANIFSRRFKKILADLVKLKKSA